MKIVVIHRMKHLLCISDFLVNILDMYVGVCPFSALYIIMHIWYCTRFGKGNHCSSLNMLAEGVIISAFKIFLAALF